MEVRLARVGKYNRIHLMITRSGTDRYDQGSISSTFYEQLLRSQILNAQKRQSSWQCCLALLGPTSLKAAGKMLVKLTPGEVSLHCQPPEKPV